MNARQKAKKYKMLYEKLIPKYNSLNISSYKVGIDHLYCDIYANSDDLNRRYENNEEAKFSYINRQILSHFIQRILDYTTIESYPNPSAMCEYDPDIIIHADLAVVKPDTKMLS